MLFSDSRTTTKEGVIMRFEAELEEYINGLTSQKDEKRVTRKAITIFITGYLKDSEWPCAEDFTRYEAESKYSPDVMKANTRRVRKFFAWLQQHGTTSATQSDENATKPTEADKTVDASVVRDDESNEKRTEATTATMATATATTAQEATAEAVTAQAPAPVKHGRKAKSATGEIKSGKVTAYLTRTQLEELKSLSAMHEMSVADYFSLLVDKERKREAENLQAFRAIQARLHQEGIQE